MSTCLWGSVCFSGLAAAAEASVDLREAEPGRREAEMLFEPSTWGRRVAINEGMNGDQTREDNPAAQIQRFQKNPCSPERSFRLNIKLGSYEWLQAVPDSKCRQWS